MKIVNVPGLGQVQFPDDMDNRSIEAAIARNLGGKSIDVEAAGNQAREQYFKDQPYMQNVATGAGKAVVDLGRGVAQILGLSSDKEIAKARESDKAITNAPGGTVGNILGNVAATIPAAFIPGANTVVGAGLIGAGLGALQPTVEGESRALNTAIGGGLGAAGQKVGGYVAGKLASKLDARKAALAAQQLQESPALQTAKAAQAAGYTFPPSQINNSVTNNALEGLSGRIQTRQVSSFRNQSVTNNLIKKALGLPEDQPISISALETLRKDAGKAYDAAKGTGTVTADNMFNSQLDDIVSRFQGAAKDFPELAKNTVVDTVESVRKPQFGADSAIDAIRILRDKADSAFAGQEKSTGKALKAAADALEEQIGRHLEKVGAPVDTLQAFQNARKLIAKTYSVQGALNNSTGNVVALKLARQLAKGKPISGEIKQVAQIGESFPLSTQEITKSIPGVSPLDWIAASGTSMASGNMLPMSWLVGRPAARNMILSPAYQKAMTSPSYSASPSLRLSELLMRDGRGAMAGQLLAPSIYSAQE